MMRLSLALWLFVCVAIAQELPTPPKPVPDPAPVPLVTPAPTVDADLIQIERPAFPLQVGVPTKVHFTGLTAEAFRNAKLTVNPWDDGTPSDGAIVEPQWDWILGKPYIAFYPVKPGRYVVTLTMHPENEWLKTRLVLLRGIADERMEKPLFDEAAAFAKQFEAKLTTKYPHKKGSALVEVAGAVPFPPPSPNNPNQPPNPNQPLPNNKISRVTYVWEKDNGPVPREVAKALQRINADSSGSVVASEFEDDTRDGNGEVPDQYKVAFEAAKKTGVPVLVVQSGPTVMKTVNAPTTEAAVMEAVK